MAFDVEVVRAAFPALKRSFNGKPLVYLDSAATALKPGVVIETERQLHERGIGNIHRGKHALSDEASDAYEQARERVAAFINAPSPTEVIFVRNTTEALNLLAAGLELTRYDEVVAAPVEHHSNLLPWMSRATVRWVKTPVLEPVQTHAVARELGPKTRAVVIGHASNVTGAIHPVRALAELAKSHGAISVVDAAQSVAHLPIDVQALGCDALAFSGHKLYGPTGIGVLWAKRALLERLTPQLWGGGTVDRVTLEGFTPRRLPHRLEAGTPHITGAVGLAAAIDWLQAVGRHEIAEHSDALARSLGAALSRVKNVRVIGTSSTPRLPLATLALEGVALSADDVATTLSDRHAIMVRSGFHCAHPLLAEAGVDVGTLRVSAGVYTTERELDAFVEALEQVLRPYVSR